MDMIHTVMLEARRDELHRARIESRNDRRILDLGTGTGTDPLSDIIRYPFGLCVALKLSGYQANDLIMKGIWALDVAE